MPRFWFSYCDVSGRLLAGFIMDSACSLEARHRAATEGTDLGAQYGEGYELDGESANLIPPQAIGRMLDRQEVRALMERLATQIVPNRTDAGSS